MAKLVSEIPRGIRNAVKKMLKNGVFWASWEQVGPKLGASRGASRQMSEGSGQLKWGDLGAFDWSMEGLYPLEGEVRNTGISEGFTGNVERNMERCLQMWKGVCI